VYRVISISPSATEEMTKSLRLGSATQEGEHSEDRAAIQSSSNVYFYMVCGKHQGMVLLWDL